MSIELSEEYISDGGADTVEKGPFNVWDRNGCTGKGQRLSGDK